MGFKIYDYECNRCQSVAEYFIREGSTPTCECGSTDLTQRMCAPHMFTTIVPTTATSKKLKAGYVHHFNNRPAEKISVSVPSKVTP